MFRTFGELTRRLRPAAGIAAMTLLLVAACAGFARATDPANDRFSPRGIKAAIALGGLDPSSTQDLEEGDASTLRIGYGIDERITFWLAMTGSEHTRERDAEGRGIKADVGGLELSMQYTISNSTRLQPYGRFGFGGYGMEDRSTHDAWAGGGVVFGLGADYFVTRHWAFGAEATYRGMDYAEGRVGKKGDFRKLADPIDGDAAGFSISVTVQ